LAGAAVDHACLSLDRFTQPRTGAACPCYLGLSERSRHRLRGQIFRHNTIFRRVEMYRIVQAVDQSVQSCGCTLCPAVPSVDDSYRQMPQRNIVMLFAIGQERLN
jgi:hypothetical protein